MARGRVAAGRVEAVLFDVDFTLAKPGPLLGPEGYREAGARHGLTLVPGRYEAARTAAVEDLDHAAILAHFGERLTSCPRSVRITLSAQSVDPRGK